MKVFVNDGSKDNDGRGSFEQYPTSEDITLDQAWQIVETLIESGGHCVVLDYP